MNAACFSAPGVITARFRATSVACTRCAFAVRAAGRATTIAGFTGTRSTAGFTSAAVSSARFATMIGGLTAAVIATGFAAAMITAAPSSAAVPHRPSRGPARIGR